MESTSQDIAVPELDPLSDDFVIRSFGDAVAWFRARNPDMATNRPQDLDWQAIKAEGRRY